MDDGGFEIILFQVAVFLLDEVLKGRAAKHFGGGKV